MAWQGLHLSNPARMSLRQGLLRIEPQDDEALTFHLEDLGYIVIDSPQVTLTAPLLAACAETGCMIVTSDARHMPNGVLLPFHAYHRQTETLQAQLELSLPTQKRLWQRIVQRKIKNQAACLALLGHAEEAKAVEVLARKVQSGDSGNTEALAARIQWGALLARTGRDHDADDRANAMLNYGYALVRALLARHLAGLGFALCLGMHHRSLQNAFNLADDLIEPWRPFVDRLALSRPDDARKDFSREDRQHLCTIFQEPILVSGSRHTLLSASRLYVESFRTAVLERDCKRMVMPRFAETKA